MEETIPESIETKAARDALWEALDITGAPSDITRAIEALIEAKITDAIEYAADRIERQIATSIRSGV
jgi:hypothetical protein